MWTLADKYNVLTAERAARELLAKLKKFAPYIYKSGRTRRSFYIHFRNLPNNLDHKLRVSDHDERERYGYKWQLRLDGFHNIKRRRPFSKYFVEIDKLVFNFERFYDNITRLNAELEAKRDATDDEDGEN